MRSEDEATPTPPLIARLRAEVERLEDEVERLRRIVRLADSGVVEVDLRGRILEINRVAQQAFGLPGEAALGRPVEDLYVDPESRGRLLERLEAAPDRVIREDLRLKTFEPPGARWCELSVAWRLDGEGQRVGVTEVSRDVTQRRELEDRLRQLTITDKLTGLYNQSHLYSRWEIEKERARRLGHTLSLVVFDLDGFKEVNDTEGHLVGDQVLRRLGQVLLEEIRLEVDSAFRMGGDEFCVLLPGADRAQACRFAERIRARIAGEQLQGVTASLGVCAYDPGAPALQVLDHADQAMYVAKRAGGDRVAFYRPEAARAFELLE